MIPLKDVQPDELLKSIHDVVEGKPAFTRWSPETISEYSRLSSRDRIR